MNFISKHGRQKVLQNISKAAAKKLHNHKNVLYYKGNKPKAAVYGVVSEMYGCYGRQSTHLNVLPFAVVDHWITRTLNYVEIAQNCYVN